MNPVYGFVASEWGPTSLPNNDGYNKNLTDVFSINTGKYIWFAPTNRFALEMDPDNVWSAAKKFGGRSYAGITGVAEEFQQSDFVYTTLPHGATSETFGGILITYPRCIQYGNKIYTVIVGELNHRYIVSGVQYDNWYFRSKLVEWDFNANTTTFYMLHSTITVDSWLNPGQSNGNNFYARGVANLVGIVGDTLYAGYGTLIDGATRTHHILKVDMIAKTGSWIAFTDPELINYLDNANVNTWYHPGVNVSGTLHFVGSTNGHRTLKINSATDAITVELESSARSYTYLAQPYLVGDYIYFTGDKDTTSSVKAYRYNHTDGSILTGSTIVGNTGLNCFHIRDAAANKHYVFRNNGQMISYDLDTLNETVHWNVTSLTQSNILAQISTAIFITSAKNFIAYNGGYNRFEWGGLIEPSLPTGEQGLTFSGFRASDGDIVSGSKNIDNLSAPIVLFDIRNWNGYDPIIPNEGYGGTYFDAKVCAAYPSGGFPEIELYFASNTGYGKQIRYIFAPDFATKYETLFNGSLTIPFTVMLITGPFDNGVNGSYCFASFGDNLQAYVDTRFSIDASVSSPNGNMNNWFYTGTAFGQNVTIQTADYTPGLTPPIPAPGNNIHVMTASIDGKVLYWSKEGMLGPVNWTILPPPNYHDSDIVYDNAATYANTIADQLTYLNTGSSIKDFWGYINTLTYPGLPIAPYSSWPTFKGYAIFRGIPNQADIDYWKTYFGVT